MHWLLQPFYPRDVTNTQKLILSAAPERRECVEAWSQMPSEPDEEGFIRRDYVVVNANDPTAVIGYGAIWPQREGRFRMDLIVAPGWRRQGIGSALFHHLLNELQDQKATIVQARTPEDRAEALAFLVRRGFTETNRMIHLRLQVTNASTTDLTALTMHMKSQGITIVTLGQEQKQVSEYAEKIQALLCTANPERVGNPYRVGNEAECCSAEDAKRIWESYRPLQLDAFFLAKMREGYVGLSFLGVGDAAGPVVQGDTAVHRDWRRQGVATLLKLHTILYAQQHGFAQIATSTASPGMLALNQRLGYEVEWAEVRMVKELTTG